MNDNKSFWLKFFLPDARMLTEDEIANLPPEKKQSVQESGDACEDSYNQLALAGWAGAFFTWQRKGKEVYCAFDNDEAGYAVQNALALQSMIS